MTRRHVRVISGGTACRRTMRWLVEEHGWVVVLQPALLLLGLAVLLLPSR